MWTRGDPVVLQYWRRGRLAFVHPVTVVSDTPESIALDLAMGTLIKVRVGEDSRLIPRSLPYEAREAGPWRLGDDVDTRVFAGWYGNFQAPLVRTAIGFGTTDYVLDVDSAADGAWDWQDEDEFAAAQRLGHISPAEAVAIRAAGAAVIAALEQGQWPFNSGWEAWQPDPTWPMPTLPPGWDTA